MATYTVRAGDTWFSLEAKLGVDARTLKQQNRGVTLARGVVIRTGGARYTRPADINPWGLGVGIVPTSAYETEAGTDLAKKYLKAIGQPGAIPPTEEVPEITPTEAPAITPGPGGVYDPATGRRYRTPTDVAAPTLGEPITMAGLTGAAIGPQQPLGPPGQPSPITLEPLPTTAVGAVPSIYPERPDIPEGVEPGQYVMGEGSPWYQEPGIEWGGVVGVSGELTKRARAMAPDILAAEGITAEPIVTDTTQMPTGQYVSGRVAIAQAATWTARAIQYAWETENRNYMPEVITSPVATLILSSRDFETFAGEDIASLSELFADDALSYTEVQPGVWVKNPEVTGPGGYTTGGVGYTGRRYGRGRGSRGGGYGSAGGVQYGPRLTQWRIRGFG